MNTESCELDCKKPIFESCLFGAYYAEGDSNRNFSRCRDHNSVSMYLFLRFLTLVVSQIYEEISVCRF